MTIVLTANLPLNVSAAQINRGDRLGQNLERKR